jgi:ABC-type dipeptide/oligopeptide/nickel transport system ATPase component
MPGSLLGTLGQAGYFETEHSEQIVPELKLEIKAGKLVALSGIVGCGKTTTLRRIQEALSQDKEILASKSLSLEKSQISLATLIMALFYDLATEKVVAASTSRIQTRISGSSLISVALSAPGTTSTSARDTWLNPYSALSSIPESVFTIPGCLATRRTTAPGRRLKTSCGPIVSSAVMPE